MMNPNGKSRYCAGQDCRSIPGGLPSLRTREVKLSLPLVSTIDLFVEEEVNYMVLKEDEEPLWMMEAVMIEVGVVKLVVVEFVVVEVERWKGDSCG